MIQKSINHTIPSRHSISLAWRRFICVFRPEAEGQDNGSPLIQSVAKAFTLIELITVIAVGAVLMAMILPIAQGARRQYSIAQTKAQFHRYILAMEQFRAEYGLYPYSGETSPVLINEPTGRFVELLSGKADDGSAMSDVVALARNPKKLSFLQFNSDELTADEQIQDSFGQNNIELYMDTDTDGFLDGLSNIRGTLGLRSNGPKEIITSWQ